MRRFPVIAVAGTACGAVIILSACTSNAPVTSTPAGISTQQTTASTTSPSAAAPDTSAAAVPSPTSRATFPVATAPASSSPVAEGCASESRPANYVYPGSPASSITVCPGRAAVGDVVHITIQGCDTSAHPVGVLVFLGPSAFVGSSGGGVEVPFQSANGERATATFTIPASYTGGEQGTAPNPTLPVKAGGGYAFATYPAGVCGVPFTVTSAGR